MAKDVEFEFDIVVSLPKGAGDEDAIMDAFLRWAAMMPSLASGPLA